MNRTFEGQVMLITGAAQGIGERVAELAAAQGARLALVDRSALVQDLRARLEALTEVIAIEADLEQFDGAEQAAAQTHARFGRIDILVNNVGGTIWAKPYEHYAPQEIEAEVRRSLFPTLWGCRAVLPYMLEQEKGAIVNVSSIATRSVNRVPYGAAKGGVNALTACLAFEYGERGIRINAVAPGGTQAPPRRVPRNSAEPSSEEKAWYQQIVDQTVASTLMKRYGTLDEQAEAILFLASDHASYITGTVLPVGGGDQG
ncbi:MAG: benzoate diol dehydrogenase BenD [Comamonas sp.]